MEYYYCNLLDSVVYANFKGHQYFDTFSSESILENFLEKLKSSSYAIILTLNQICDNQIFFNEKIFNLISKLIEQGKIKISTYNDHNLITYTRKALQSCIIRLSQGEGRTNTVYISSLFPELGERVTNSKRIMKYLIGYETNLFYDNNCKKLIKKTDKKEQILDFNELIKDGKYGIYTAFEAYVSGKTDLKKTNFSSFLRQNSSLTKYFDENFLFLEWLKRLTCLNDLCINKKNIFIENETFIKDNKLTFGSIVKAAVKNNEWIDNKIKFFLNYRREPDNYLFIKNGIIEILEKLSEENTRSDMYTCIRKYMNDYAERNEVVHKNFYTITDHEQNDTPYRRVYFTILGIIDLLYNIFNTFLSVKSKTMIEYILKIDFNNDGSISVCDSRFQYSEYNIESEILIYKQIKEI